MTCNYDQMPLSWCYIIFCQKHLVYLLMIATIGSNETRTIIYSTAKSL